MIPVLRWASVALIATLSSAAMVRGAAAPTPAAPRPAVAPAGKAAARPAPGAAAESPPASAADLKARLLAEGTKVRAADPYLAVFRQYAAACAREKLVPAVVSEEFWAWLSANKDLRDAVIIGLYPGYDPNVVKRLADLHAKSPDDVASHPHLAFAFAVVYGRAGKRSMRPSSPSFAARDRECPTMEDSFAWYIQNEKAMRSSLKTTPWPMLLYVADNDAPLAERTWALQAYGAAQPTTYGKIYYDVAYDDDAVGGKPGRLGTEPATLANIKRLGGVCSHRAYFSSRVLKSMGIPALYDSGEGGRGGHAWVGWVGREGQTVDLVFSGRFDYDNYYTGTTFDPMTRQKSLDRDVQLAVAAMLRSYTGWLDAMALCGAYQLFEGEARAKATGLLETAIQRNAYCDLPWRLIADGVAAGVLPQKQGERLCDQMVKAFATYPDLTFTFLAKILEPRLSPGDKPPAAETAANLQLLEKAYQFYEKSKRPDLAVKLRCLQGQYLEALGRRDDALKLYVLASEKYVTEHFGFVDLFERAVKVMGADKKGDLCLKYMKMVAEKVPEYTSDWNRKFELKNPVFVHVATAYAGALRSANNPAEAQLWEARAKKRES